jgi:DHA2 family multidrug resistance protein
MMFGLASFGLSMWGFTYITSDWTGDQLLIPQILRGFPQVFAVAPSVTLGLGSLPPARLKYASGLFNMMRNLGGAVGIAVCGAVLNDRTNAHFLDIATTLTPANQAMNGMLGSLQTHLTAVLGSAPSGHVAALQQLRAIAYREASTMAYADAFRTIMLAFLVTVPLVPLLRKVLPPKAPPADAH